MRSSLGILHIVGEQECWISRVPNSLWPLWVLCLPTFCGHDFLTVFPTASYCLQMEYLKRKPVPPGQLENEITARRWQWGALQGEGAQTKNKASRKDVKSTSHRSKNKRVGIKCEMGNYVVMRLRTLQRTLPFKPAHPHRIMNGKNPPAS